MDNRTLPFKAGGFAAEIDPGTGALTALRDPRDPQAMNWVSHVRENAWALASHAWGLGFVAVAVGVGLQRWQVADAVRITARRAGLRVAHEGSRPASGAGADRGTLQWVSD